MGATQANDGRFNFHPPFHRVSRYRDPGRVNINTARTHNIWNAITGDHPGPTFNQFVASRRGYGAYDDPMLKLNPRYPTFFANPVRPPGTGNLAPIPALQAPYDAGVTMMRPTGPLAAMTDPNLQPLFANTSASAHNDTNRNSYFRYQVLQRMANLTTTRSNVFAIWITVGYFEVLPHPTSGTPSLSAELGSETGNIERHRGFYVVDRSIPIAFQPGQNHNMERAVLLRRFIE